MGPRDGAGALVISRSHRISALHIEFHEGIKKKKCPLLPGIFVSRRMHKEDEDTNIVCAV